MVDLDDAIGSGPVCPECGADLIPEPLASELGIRIVYVCPAHGMTSVVNPFDES